MSYQSLRRKLISLGITVTAKSLYNQVISLKKLSDPPLCYTLINEKSIAKLTDQNIELLIPIKIIILISNQLLKVILEKHLAIKLSIS